MVGKVGGKTEGRQRVEEKNRRERKSQGLLCLLLSPGRAATAKGRVRQRQICPREGQAEQRVGVISVLSISPAKLSLASLRIRIPVKSSVVHHLSPTTFYYTLHSIMRRASERTGRHGRSQEQLTNLSGHIASSTNTLIAFPTIGGSAHPRKLVLLITEQTQELPARAVSELSPSVPNKAQYPPHNTVETNSANIIMQSY